MLMRTACLKLLDAKERLSRNNFQSMGWCVTNLS